MGNNHRQSRVAQEPSIDRRTVMKASAALGTLALSGATFGATGVKALPDGPEADEDTVALQMFHREWTEIESRIPDVADSGFDAIWVQQPAEMKLDWNDLTYDGTMGFYDEVGPYGHRDPHPPIGYQPVDLRNFDSSLGTEDELESLIETAHEHDIEVIVDTVLNHMADPVGPDGRIDWPQFDENEHFHNNGTLGDDCRVDGEAANYECDLLGLPSLDIEHPEVQSAHEAYIEKIASLGADGLRYDAAAHVWPWYFAENVNPLADDLDLWRVAEVWEESDIDRLLEWADTGMTVFDFPLHAAISDAFENGSMENLSQNAAPGVAHRDPSVAVTFVQNHDAVGPGVQPTDDAQTVPEGRAVELAEAFILAYAGMPMLYRSGPEEYHELEDEELSTLVTISKEFAHGEVIDRDVGIDHYVFEREGNLLTGINKGGQPRSVAVDSSWANTVLVDATGTGDDIEVDSSGKITVEIPAEGYVMYVEDADSIPAERGVSFDSLEYTVDEAESVDIGVTASAGDEPLTADVTLAVDGTEEATQSVDLDTESSTAVEFELGTADLDDGEYDLKVAIPDDSDTATLLVGSEADGGDLTLRTTVDVGYGQSVYFTGSTDELTDWGGGIEGTWSEGNVWEVTIADPGEFEWKTRRGPSGETGDVWERGDNHDHTDLEPSHQGWADDD
ncbi:alpha-amylase domain-containing protein [Halostagnicola kamekurae]|uniref:Alpha-amylase n=2 Tax=Halostagnicola kamekurae TaxID=619731 RepID=A0A1I6PQ40_9EURY|nr:alpha-amylase [Halostagnicola kamekurae]